MKTRQAGSPSISAWGRRALVWRMMREKVSGSVEPTSLPNGAAAGHPPWQVERRIVDRLRPAWNVRARATCHVAHAVVALACPVGVLALAAGLKACEKAAEAHGGHFATQGRSPGLDHQR